MLIGQDQQMDSPVLSFRGHGLIPIVHGDLAVARPAMEDKEQHLPMCNRYFPPNQAQVECASHVGRDSLQRWRRLGGRTQRARHG